MTVGTGVSKNLRYKAETTWGVAPSAAGAQSLRRVESSLDLRKQTYQSAEIRTDFQVSDMRHGVRSVEGAIRGELSSATWEDFFAAALRRDFTAVTDISLGATTLTIAASGDFYTITRSAGSYITDGMKVGNVIRITGGAFNANNMNHNFLVVELTATVATVLVLNGETLTAEGPIGSGVINFPGKKTFVPTTGHTDKSFGIEHYFSDLDESELFLGCKISRVGLELPATGLSMIAMDMLGKDVTVNSGANAPYYTSPTAETTTGVMAAVNGALIVQGLKVATVTGLTMNLNGNMSADAVVGSNTYPDIFEGRVVVDGQFTAFFENITLRDYFINETEVSLVVALTASNADAADFLAITLPRIKVGGAAKDDGEKGLVQTLPFTALYNSTGGASNKHEQSTIAIQDSGA
jgi:hypothetical protein